MGIIHLVTAAVISFGILSPAFAQEEGGRLPSGQAISIHTGPLLPSAFPPTDEIMRAFGFRYAYPIGPSSLIEGGYTSSRTDGVTFQDLSLSIRGELPVQDLTILALAGTDLLRLKSPSSQDYAYYASFHAGGGLLASLAHNTYLRMEMRFNFHPGTLLFFGFGLEFRFGAGGGEGGG